MKRYNVTSSLSVSLSTRAVFLSTLILTPAAAQFTGAAACAECHQPQAAAQKRSAHSYALSRRADHWSFGAGRQASTPVSRLDPDHYLEHGLSQYTRSNSKALTPGHTNPNGVKYRVFDPGAQILRCFQCHSTGKLAFTREQGIQPAELGVQCEACHGPGADHAQLLRPKILNPAGLNDLCGACHRQPPKPGEDVNWQDPWNVRHQPVSLSQSACFQKGNLSCTTCHDPHSGETKSTCATCHPAVSHKSKITTQSCESCHMPKVAAGPQLTFSNHWIGTYAPLKPLLPLPRSKGAAGPTAR